MSKIQKYISKFVTNYKSNIELIVQNGLLLKDARTDLNDNEWNDLQKNLKLTYRLTQAITRIGKNKILTDAKYYKLLPPNLFSIYELTKLNEQRLLELIRSEKINSNTSRFEIQKLLGLRRPEKIEKKVNTIRYLNIRLHNKNFSLKYLQEIQKDIRNLVSKYKDKVELSLEDFDIEKRFVMEKDILLIKLSGELKREKDKKNYKKIFESYKERIEKLGKDTLDESKKLFNSY